jgi:heterotetrameric sarcosine oxidase gamma subunit
VTLEFLSPAAGRDDLRAQSPFAEELKRAGAVFEERGGWDVPVRIGDEGVATRACADAVGWADASHLGKLELQVASAHVDALAGLAGGLSFGTAVRHEGAWWGLVSPSRALVLCEPERRAALHDELAAESWLSVVDVSTQLCALRLRGPQSREVIARYCALDLRPHKAPVTAFRPGSVARTPGYVLREDDEQYLTLLGSAYASYYWEVVADAAELLGGRAVGATLLGAPAEEAGARA